MKIDQIHEMVRGANPVPNLDVLEPIEMPFLPDRERSGEMSTKQINGKTPEPRRPRVRRGLLIGAATVALVVIVGVALAFVTGGKVEPGPITSFEDIAGTTYKRGPGHSPIYLQFTEDGTWNASTNRDLVEDRPSNIYETRFEGTKIFVTETSGYCDDNPDAIYEIHLLENGNLEFVAIEDPCAHRSGDFEAEWAPVP